MKLKLKSILPNPYRDLKGNPLRRDKIEELIASINTTGFWDNVVVRKNKDGKYELAYGHHRVQAAIEVGIVEADFIVKELSDALMIQIMDNENREVYASSPASMIESVKAVVQALSTGSVELVDMSSENLKDGRTAPSYGLRYAPSYVPANYSVEENIKLDRRKAYTPLAIARFLGRAVSKGTTGEEQPARAIDAALDFLCLKELGKINNAVLLKEGRPISATKLASITSEIKQRHVAEVVRRGKTAAEIARERQKQLDLQKKMQEDAKKAEEERKVHLQKMADAARAENEAKADKLAKELKENDKRAKEKEALSKLRMAELDAQIKAKQEWEAQQRVQDAYLPIRRDVEAMLGKLETIVSERNPFREDVKSLSGRKGLRPEDRLRLRKAVVAVADWYGEWVAAQFAPELKAAQKIAVDKRKASQPKKENK